MPKKSYTKKRRTTKKRTYKKKAKMYRQVGFPKRMFAKLRYFDVISASNTVTSGSSISFIYQSSIYDPYAGTGGHQPLYADQYQAVYGYYRVYAMSYNVKLQTEAQSSVGLTACVMPSRDGLTFTNISAICERKGAKFQPLSGQFPARMKGYMSVANTWGVSKKEVRTDNDFAAALASNPVKMTFLTFQVFNDGASSADVLFTIDLNYYVEFFGTISVNTS